MQAVRSSTPAVPSGSQAPSAIQSCSLNPLLSFNPLDYLTNDLPANQNLLADAANGTLGYSINILNTFAVATGNPSGAVTGGVFAYDQYTNVSNATLESGALVNQDDDAEQASPRFRTGNQSVSVTADTDMTMVNVVGIGTLTLSFAAAVNSFDDLVTDVGSPVKNLLDGVEEIVTPATDCACNGIGASLYVDNVKNSTIADVAAGTKVYTGASWALNFEPAAVSGKTHHDGPAVERRDRCSTHLSDERHAHRRAGERRDILRHRRSDQTRPDRARLDPGGCCGSAMRSRSSQVRAWGANRWSRPASPSPPRPRSLISVSPRPAPSSSGFGIAGSITVGLVNNTTQAIVEPGAQLISGGGIDVSALDDLTRIGIDGSLAKSQSSVVGVSLGVNVVSRDTEAYIGTGYSGGTLLAAGNANTIVTAAGPIAIGATTTGNLWSAAIAGTDAASSSSNNNTIPGNGVLKQYAPTQLLQFMGLSQLGSDPVQTNFGADDSSLSGAGAATINVVTEENTRAFINDTGTITAGQQLSIEARADSSIWALAGSLALNMNSDQDSSTGLAGAIGVNILKADDRAFVAAAQVTAGSVNVAAERSGGIRALTAGASCSHG